jgi:hypothetical protein
MARSELDVEAGKYGFGEAQKLIPQAESGLTEAESFWKPLLSGDRQKMLETVAPTVNSMIRQFREAQGRVSEEMPRGGARSLLQSELPFREASAITELLQKLQPEAAGRIEQLATERGALGLNLMPGQTGATGQLLDYAMQNKQYGYKVGTDIGESLGALLSNLISGKKTN